MHVLRLQSCDTLWVLMYMESVWNVLCVCFFGLLFISLFRFVSFLLLQLLLWHQLKQSKGYCQLCFGFRCRHTIQYSLFIYSDNYQIRSAVNISFIFSACIFSLALPIVCSRMHAVAAHNEYACIMRTKFNWQHRASIECGSRVFVFAIA